MPPKPRQDKAPEPAPAPVIRVTRAAAKREAAATVPEEKKAKKAKGDKQKKEKKDAAAVHTEKKAEEGEGEGEGHAFNNKIVVVEHCKQCNQFKMRANLVKEGLEKAGCGISVVLNPQKPRRGCFEIRQEGGKKFITLLDMKRPFKPMRDLDMDKVISDIIDEMSKN
ncbi:hypothetical protein Fmac_032162 [Flemingia macrophylla]|uniref:Selenoprotein H n=1 Tax=Flemingia macrophylla TaxID=520843 RepID=A0ABD1L464_9FABA